MMVILFYFIFSLMSHAIPLFISSFPQSVKFLQEKSEISVSEKSTPAAGGRMVWPLLIEVFIFHDEDF